MYGLPWLGCVLEQAADPLQAKLYHGLKERLIIAEQLVQYEKGTEALSESSLADRGCGAGRWSTVSQLMKD